MKNGTTKFSSPCKQITAHTDWLKTYTQTSAVQRDFKSIKLKQRAGCSGEQVAHG